jgi:hypothetical protein
MDRAFRPARAAVTLLVVWLAAACGGTPGATLVTPSSGAQTTSSAGASASPSFAASPSPVPGGPAVAFETPADGSTVPAGNVTLTAAVTGFEVVDKIGNPPVPGEGHLVFYVGVDYVPTQPGRLAHTAPGTFAVSTQPTYTWPGLEPGKYGIAVQLVNNDDSALQPPVTAMATITVQ